MNNSHALIVGKRASGKTTLAKHYINSICSTNQNVSVHYLSEVNDLNISTEYDYNDKDRVTKTLEKCKSDNLNNKHIIVIDDSIHNLKDTDMQLLTDLSNRINVSIIIIIQCFYDCKYHDTINFSSIFLTRECNTRDNTKILQLVKTRLQENHYSSFCEMLDNLERYKFILLNNNIENGYSVYDY